MPKKIFKCTVAYDGSFYCGWQKQKNGKTIQGMLEYAAEKYFGFPVKINGAGRTDAGVHALGQVFDFRVNTRLEPKNIKAILNGLLPPEIMIKKAEEACPGFSSRHDVKQKFYRYVICDSGKYTPFLKGRCWQAGGHIDCGKMSGALKIFKGTKDYFSFSASGSAPKNHIREIKSIKLKRNGKFIYLDFKGKSFLYNMIRKVSAVLVMYARGEMDEKGIESLFAVRDRSKVKFSAPPDGLYLVKITYNKQKARRPRRHA